MAARSIVSAILRFGTSTSLLLFARYTVADDQLEPNNRAEQEIRETSHLIKAELPRWGIAAGADEKKLKLDPTPILRWTNPATGRIFGEIYVWAADGRPEAVMSLYKAWEPAWGFAAEFHSLSLTRIVAHRDGAIAWKCNQPGVTLRDLPDAPAVADSARRRLQQMRALAGDFSAVLIDRRRNPEGERQALRLLAKPVYRYMSEMAELLDGAIFAFVVGTDAEALLILEARGTESKQQWQYALARLNRDELVVSLKDQEVWRVDLGVYGERDKPYFLMGLPELPPAQ